MKNIVLIGMPACGKSSVGVILAKTAAMSFVDTDLLIQEREGEKLQFLIDNRGMDAFLKIEESVLTDLKAEHSVISTGGSAVYSEAAMKNLGENGVIVYLKLPLGEIERRLNNIKTRGIAMKPGESLSDLYDYRVPFYERYADLTIEAEGLSIEEIIEEILKRV